LGGALSTSGIDLTADARAHYGVIVDGENDAAVELDVEDRK